MKVVRGRTKDNRIVSVDWAVAIIAVPAMLIGFALVWSQTTFWLALGIFMMLLATGYRR